jgi:hypothetical protein
MFGGDIRFTIGKDESFINFDHIAVHSIYSKKLGNEDFSKHFENACEKFRNVCLQDVKFTMCRNIKINIIDHGINPDKTVYILIYGDKVTV